MICLVKTDKSFLNILSYKNHKEVIDRCIEEVKDCLDIKPTIKFMGKIVHQQRDVGFFSNETHGYYYSGKLAESKPLKSNLVELLKIVNTQFGASYNGILVNRYNDGNNYISYHYIKNIKYNIDHIKEYIVDSVNKYIPKDLKIKKIINTTKYPLNIN